MCAPSGWTARDAGGDQPLFHQAASMRCYFTLRPHAHLILRAVRSKNS